MALVIPGGWSPAPHQLLDAMARPGGAARIQVYLLISRYGNGSGKGCWASVATLAAGAGLAAKTVRRALADLLAGGWISHERRPGITGIYRACFVPQAGAQGPGTPGAEVEGGVAIRSRGDDQGVRSPGTGVIAGVDIRGRGDGQGVWSPGADEQEPKNKTSSPISLSPMSSAAAGQGRSGKQGGAGPGAEEQPQPAPPAPFEVFDPATIPQTREELIWELAVAADFVPLTPPPDRPDWPTPPAPLYRDWGWEFQKVVRLAAQAYKGPPGGPEDPFWQIVKADPDFEHPWPYGTARLEPPTPRPQRRPAPPPLPVTTRLPVQSSELPLPLQPIADRIEDYWAARSGPRTAGAFWALVEELELVVRGAGHSGARELLRQAMQAGWPALNAELWLAQRRREPDLGAHPAYQAFCAP